MTTDARGLYVHIPFCRRKCNYCDFCSYADVSDALTDAYISRLREEAGAYSREERIPVDTVYFGGGTPSLLAAQRLEEIISALYSDFDILDSAEITLEANPGTLTTEKALAYKSLGINRISLGVQTIHQNELKLLGRIHLFDDFVNSYKLLRTVGFDNISLDLMYGIPEQTVSSFRETLRYMTELSPEHISAYGLIIEPGTPFYSMRDKLPLPDEDAECEMYYTACELLGSHGYSHYEISNYARAGYASRHNLKYWRAEEYIGLGVAAYSYYKGMRYGNVRSLSEYLDSAPYSYDEELTAESQSYEYAMMRLRLSEGFSLPDYKARFGRDFLSGKEGIIEKLKERNLLKISGERIALTEEGFYVSNAILAEIL